jgi:hypothetical protein
LVEVDEHTFADEQGRLRLVVAVGGEPASGVVEAEVGGDEFQPGRVRPHGPHAACLVRLGEGMVDLEEADTRRPEPQGAVVVAGANHDDLPDAGGDGGDQVAVEEPGPFGHLVPPSFGRGGGHARAQRSLGVGIAARGVRSNQPGANQGHGLTRPRRLGRRAERTGCGVPIPGRHATFGASRIRRTTAGHRLRRSLPADGHVPTIWTTY